MAFMEGRTGLGHGFFQKNTPQLLRPAPLLSPLEWFSGVSSYQTEASLSGIFFPGVEDRSFVDGLFAEGDEPVRNRDGGRKTEKHETAKNGSSGSSSYVVKGQWTVEEDRTLLKLVKQHGVRKWSQIAQHLAGRIGKQCRERWHNHLRPDIKKDTWSEEEERLLVEAHEKVGNKWAEIAKSIPGRTENAIKNHWNATKRRQNSRRKCRKTTALGRKSQPSILQDYIQRMTSKETKSTTTTTTSTTTVTTPTTTEQTQVPSNSFSNEQSPMLTTHKEQNTLPRFNGYAFAPTSDNTSMGSSRREEERRRVEQLERTLLSDDYLVDEYHQDMGMDEFAFFGSSPITDYFSDNSFLEATNTSTTPSSTPTETTNTGCLRSDQYIAYLLDRVTSSFPDESNSPNLEFMVEQDDQGTPVNYKREMDLIEMVSSNQVSRSSSFCSGR